jgi:transketolase
MADSEKLKELCKLIRYDILTSTTTAGSGHPTSSLSAVELMTTLFFGDIMKPEDKIIFSKGHASPLLYSLYHAAGLITYEELMTLRKFDSNLEGHPTPRFSFVDVATGSLGQGLSIGLGMAMGKKSKVYVLLGDSELAEGQNWEAMEIAGYYKLNNLVGILDVNRLGQRGETMLGWDLKTYQKRIESFGWETVIIDDGHDLRKISDAFECITNFDRSVKIGNKPVMIIAKTIKGKGVSFLENVDGWHGKAVPKERLQETLKELGDINNVGANFNSPVKNNVDPIIKGAKTAPLQNPFVEIGQLVATREAYGNALVQLGKIIPNLVVLDAETSNSTFSDKFKTAFPHRFFEMFIAEQNMVSAALGLSKTGHIPFISTFSAFLTRAFDQIRMTQYSDANLKIVGSHCGVSIGSDGPSQMGLEDISMMRSILKSVVFYPSDAVSAYKLTEIMAKRPGLFYLRTTREKTPVIYDANEKFEVGGSKLHEVKSQKSKVKNTTQNSKVKSLIISAGITLHEALKAQKELANEEIETVVMDCYSIKPIDSKTINDLAKKIKNIIVVEDHYPAGGLGEAVLSALAENFKFQISNFKFSHLAVRKTPHSGTPEELLAYEEIDSQAIINTVKKLQIIY